MCRHCKLYIVSRKFTVSVHGAKESALCAVVPEGYLFVAACVIMFTSQDVLSFLGVSPAVGRFLLFYVASIPCCWLHRFIRGATLRHIFSAATGALLSYLAFGVGANLHFAVTIMIGYLAMLLDRRRSGLITFAAAMTFLIGWSALFRPVINVILLRKSYLLGMSGVMHGHCNQ